MKKTLLTLAILTATGSANAAMNVYNKDGVKVDFDTAAEVQYFRSFDPAADGVIRLDESDSSLALNTTVFVSENLNAIAGMDFEAISTKLTNDELWVGFDSDKFGRITFGRQYLISDDAGVGKDYELGTESGDFVQTNGNQVIKYIYDTGTFYLGASGQLKESGDAYNSTTSSATSQNDTKIFDARIGARFAGVDARVYYYTGDSINSSSFFATTSGSNIFTDVDGYNLEAEYSIDALNLAAAFGQVKYKETMGTNEIDVSAYQISADYTINKTKFAIGYNFQDKTKDTVNGKDTAYTVYANITQQIHKNVAVYAEIGDTNAKYSGQDADFGYLAGMKVTF